MANERGSIKISTANEIGTALVTKLGGSGYAPNDWDKMIKLLGIARQDANPALSVLSDSSGIGSERGSILLSKANSIGAMLNKKYYTSEGFAPKKWASAISKLKALTTNTASGSIIGITDGADDMDLLNYEATIPARLDSVSSVHGKRTGKNLVIQQPVYSDNTISLCMDMGSDVSVSYVTLSFKATNTVAESGVGAIVDFREEDGTHHYRTITGFKDSNNNTFQLNTPQNGYFSNTYANIKFRYIYIYYVKVGYAKIQTDSISDWQVELGNVRTAYEAPVTPVSYEVSLGRSIYGGKANLITGEGKVNVNRVQIKDLSWTYYTSGTNPIFYAGNVTDMKTYARGEMPNIAFDGYTKRTSHSRSYLSSNMEDMECSAIENAQTITFRNDSYTSREAMLEAIGDEYIVYETTTEESFTFEPITIKTMEGNNDFWVNEGTSDIEYYQKPTAYTRATLTGAVVRLDNARIDLPFTKAKITIEPTVLGKSSASLYKGGKNFLDPSVVFSAPAIYNYNNSLGSVTVLKSDDRAWSNMPSISIKPGTYVINNPNGRIQYVLASESYQTVHGITSASGTITIASNDSIKIKMGLGASYPFTASYQLELGTTPTTFEKYIAPSRIISDLGSTVYGATVDLATGKVIREYALFTFDGTQAVLSGNYGTGGYVQYSCQVLGIDPDIDKPLVDEIYEDSSTGDYRINSFVSSGAKRIIFNDIRLGDTITSKEQWNAYLAQNPVKVAYPLSIPETYNITPKIITCRNGMNNFWSGGNGNTEIEYFVAE